jgi:hypothetical protein
MSFEHLLGQLPSERKPEKRVATIILCGDDEPVLSTLHTILCAPPAYINPTAPGAAACAAPTITEQPVDTAPEEGADELDGYRIPSVLKSAKSLLGSLGSTLAGLNSEFANALGLIDTDTGPEGIPGKVQGMRQGLLRVCTRTISSSNNNQQDWTLVIVWVRTPVPGYEGWKRVLRCVCSPARFPNAVVWYCRSSQSLYTNPDEEEAAKVLLRLSQFVPIVGILANPQPWGVHVAEVDGQYLGPESDGLALALMRTGTGSEGGLR